jgi:hypothetical protein
MFINLIVPEVELKALGKDRKQWDLPLTAGSGKSRVARFISTDLIDGERWFTYQIVNKYGLPEALREMRKQTPGMESTVSYK